MRQKMMHLPAALRENQSGPLIQYLQQLILQIPAILRIQLLKGMLCHPLHFIVRDNVLEPDILIPLHQHIIDLGKVNPVCDRKCLFQIPCRHLMAFFDHIRPLPELPLCLPHGFKLHQVFLVCRQYKLLIVYSHQYDHIGYRQIIADILTQVKHFLCCQVRIVDRNNQVPVPLLLTVTARNHFQICLYQIMQVFL